MEIDLRQRVARLVDARNQQIVTAVVIGEKSTIMNVIGGKRLDDSRRLIEYDPFGKSRSYAVQIGRRDDVGDWLLVLGLTGQTYRLQKKGAVHAIVNRQRSHSR